MGRRKLQCAVCAYSCVRLCCAVGEYNCVRLCCAVGEYNCTGVVIRLYVTMGFAIQRTIE